jgi:hypothetical protein
MTNSEIVEAEKPTKTRGPYRVSARLARCLELLASGTCRTQLEACAEAGMTPRALQLAMKRESVREHLQASIRQSLGISAQRAARRMHELIDSDNAMAAFRASSFALATGAAIVPPNANSPGISLNVTQNVGYLIDLRPQEPDSRGGGAPIDGDGDAQISALGGVLLDPA